ncbi:tagatose-6-phosphate ketose isomerase, partial [Streptomyces sp. S9]|nr:tagatose-6-phosphate ketose isomerase [Streptomyces sp. S9]
EQDLLDELRRDGVAGQVLAIGPHSDIGSDDEHTLRVPPLGDSARNDGMLNDSWLAPVWLTFAQIYALQRSAALGLTPDNPFPDGTVNRVVKGVTIHQG